MPGRYRTSKRIASSVRDTVEEELDRRVADRLDEDERGELAECIEEWTRDTVNGRLKTKAADPGRDHIEPLGRPVVLRVSRCAGSAESLWASHRCSRTRARHRKATT